jgi:hypothetical protein
VFFEGTYLKLYLCLAMAESFQFRVFINFAHRNLVELHGRYIDGRSGRRRVTTYTG